MPSAPQLAPARAGRHHDRAREHVLAVVEVDADEALGPVGELDARWKLDRTASKRRACSVALRVSSAPEMPVGKPR